MRLIPAGEAGRLYEAMGPAIERSGGSAANTIAGLASFGAKCGFIGRVAGDQFGGIFRHDIRSLGVAYDTPPADDGEPTARCLIFVTPDGERTMNTFLGASVELHARRPRTVADRAGERRLSRGLSVRSEPRPRRPSRRRRGLPAKSGAKVALTLSDAFCVDRHRADFRKLIREGTDIVFANEKEITEPLRGEQLRRGGRRGACRLRARRAHPLRGRLGDRRQWRDHRHCARARPQGGRCHRRRRPLRRGLPLRSHPRPAACRPAAGLAASQRPR